MRNTLRLGALGLGTLLGASSILSASDSPSDSAVESPSQDAAVSSFGTGGFDLNANAGVDPLLLQARGNRRPLMSLLDRWGWAQPLDDAGIDVFGFIEASYTYNLTNPRTDDPLGPTPAQDRIMGRMYDHHHNSLDLNRFDLFIQRGVNYTAGEWDVGFMVEMQYGIDAAMMHSNGLFDYDWPGYDSHADPEYQFDLTQAYVDVAVPVGNGLRVRTGKFVTLIGYESCDPTTRSAVQFYSRSFLLTLGMPMYHTGVVATYDFSERMSVNAGFTRGWEQSLEDNNDAIDFLGSMNYAVSDTMTVYLATSIGPQQPDNNGDWRYLLEATVEFKPSAASPWTFALDSLIAFEDNQVDDFLDQAVTPDSADATPAGETWWGGIGGWAAYKINPNLVAKGRAEWFHDEDGTRWRIPDDHVSFTAAPMSDPWVEIGTRVNAFSFTAGLDWVPFPTDAPQLLIRPELRLDLADQQIFDNGETNTQLTAALDVLFRF